MAQRVRDFYFKGGRIDQESNVGDYIKMMGDHMFLSGMQRMNR